MQTRKMLMGGYFERCARKGSCLPDRRSEVPAIHLASLRQNRCPNPFLPNPPLPHSQPPQPPNDCRQQRHADCANHMPTNLTSARRDLDRREGVGPR
ncbi:unnamed protein product [Protopolystoma xenopodis]|uniref:Uncharacterized protein n=1 Tax=Protopolystoma xenopodis TaxID=117903 RepID=A0A448XLH7_9PLAT|nr:unnamed protein product [Protopolystoma xenopodis]